MKLYLKYLSINLRAIMEYKASFFLTLFGQAIVSFSSFFVIYFLFERFHLLGGFTFEEMLLCYSVVLGAFSLSETFFRGLDRFPVLISNGQFDRILVRPRNEIFQIVASQTDLSRMGRFVQAVAVLCYALPTSGVIWSGDKILTLILMLLCGMVYFAGLFLIFAALAFFTIEGLEFMNVFTDGGREFGGYPLNIFGKGFLRFFTYILPMACFQYYPFLYLVGRSQQTLHRFSPPVLPVVLTALLRYLAVWAAALQIHRVIEKFSHSLQQFIRGPCSV